MLGADAAQHQSGASQKRRLHPAANNVLAWGLASWLCCGLVGPVAWTKGNAARKALSHSPGKYSGKLRIIFGMWLGILVTLGMVVGIIIGILSATGAIEIPE